MLSDECSELVDELRPYIERLQGLINHYGKAPFGYTPTQIIEVGHAHDDIAQCINRLERLRRVLDTIPQTKED